MATIKEIAKLAGVGTGTVSRALSGNGYVDEEKRKRIKDIAEKLNYNPAEFRKKKQEKRSGLVGIVIPNCSQPFYAGFLWHAEQALLAYGFRTVVINTAGDVEKAGEAIQLVKDGTLLGLIVNSDVEPADIEKLKQIPCVSFECEIDKQIPMVASDHIKGGRLVAKILYECGCKKVAILGVKYTTPVFARHRIEECKRSLKKRGIEVTVVEEQGKAIDYHFVEKMINRFFNSNPHIDGIFTEDMEAYFCVKQAKKRGIQVPRDLKIVGYDGSEITRMISPTITTIVQSPKELAETSVRVLCDRIEGKKTDSLYLVPVKYRRGGTTE